MAKSLKLNRAQYRRVKSMDHNQMQDFICDIYNDGYAEGSAVSEPEVKLSDVEQVLYGIKGVGIKKSAEIIRAIAKLYERGAE